jgi:phosphoglycolate phosphatase
MQSASAPTARRFDLLLLDLDGTLVDSEAILVRQMNHTIAAHGHPPVAGPTIAATIGLPLEEVFRRAIPHTDAAAVAAMCAHYRRHADGVEFVRQFQLYDDVAATLTRLRGAGARLVVATSKGRATTLDILRHCGIEALIDAVIGGDSVARGKPHPEMVEQGRALFGTSRQRSLMIGDTSFDIEMGRAAGVATCAVTYGMQPADTLRALRPSFLIERFAAVCEIVDVGSDVV